jgi:hypothetical protein
MLSAIYLSRPTSSTVVTEFDTRVVVLACHSRPVELGDRRAVDAAGMC